MIYYLNLVDIMIRVESSFPLLDNDSTKDFCLVKSSDSIADLEFIYQPVDSLPVPDDVRYIAGRRIYTGEGNEASTFFLAKPNDAPYAWVSRKSLIFGKIICNYIPGKEFLINYKRNVLTLMDLEATMLHFGAIILHASFIRWNGKGIIFSAPSGMGKSTQADLWKEYAGAEILNGDRVALRKSQGIWKAYGLPYAGTSGIYRNESAPLAAVVALRQAKTNNVCRIDGAKAFRNLYPETMIHRWDRGFENRATELLLDVLRNVSVFLLECRPDRGAVDTLKEQISCDYQE